MRSRILSVLALLLPAIAHGNVAGNATFQALSPSEIQSLQHELEATLGSSLQDGAQGLRPLEELKTRLDGPVIIPVQLQRPGRNTISAPLCFNVLVVPNRLAGWMLTLQTVYRAWNMEVGPTYTFNVQIPPGLFFWAIIGWSPCANQMLMYYRWDDGIEFWQYWHYMTANAAGGTAFIYPAIGPRFTIAGQANTTTTSGSLAVRNGGDAFCDQTFDVVTGSCTGNSIPPASVTVSYAGRMDSTPPPMPAARLPALLALAAGLSVSGVVALRRVRKRGLI